MWNNIFKKWEFFILHNFSIRKKPQVTIPISNYTYHTPLELVHLDVWGLALTLSSNGFRYYMSYIDAYSKFTWLYFLKAKSKVYSTFYHFKTQAKLHLNCKLQTLRTNWGGEFCSLTSPLHIFGDVHQPSCPRNLEKWGHKMET